MSCGKLPIGARARWRTSATRASARRASAARPPCAGTCASCALTGSVGTCSSVPPGQDPLNQCADQGVATCGTDGSCNGSGACRKYASGITCVTASCATTTSDAGRDLQHGRCMRDARDMSCAPYICRHAARARPRARRRRLPGAHVRLRGDDVQSATNVSVKVGSGDASHVHGRRWLQITNNGTTAIPLSDLTIRYWYTSTDTGRRADGSATYARRRRRTGQRSRGVDGGEPARTNADFYYQVGFVAAGRQPECRRETGSSRPSSTRTTSHFTQANDYSYNSATRS